MYHQITQSFDLKNHTCVIQSFRHKDLLLELDHYGIDGQLLKWISNYLNVRQQRVFINRSYSQYKNVKAGVPQGSVLRPLLFLIYVNYITDNLLSITRLFADDTSLAFTISNVKDLEGILNHDLREISKWSRKWLVSFNPDKTEVLYFGNQRPPLLEFNGKILTTTETHKHLGVTLSKDGRWQTHVNNIIL